MDAREIAIELTGETSTVAGARGLLRDEPGFYAWWVRPGVIPGLPSTRHPTEPVDLLYVGIAPNRPSSAQRLRSRIVGNHVGGNTGSSTFRFSLAALLFERTSWVPVRTKTKVVLPRDANRELRDWQEENARLTWVAEPEPWRTGVEAEVIERLKPPLNLAENAAHPFYATVRNARSRFRAAAQEAGV